MIKNDVRALGREVAERGVCVLALIGGQLHLATIHTVPPKFQVLSATQFIKVAAPFLAEAAENLEAVVIRKL